MVLMAVSVIAAGTGLEEAVAATVITAEGGVGNPGAVGRDGVSGAVRLMMLCNERSSPFPSLKQARGPRSDMLDALARGIQGMSVWW